VRKELVRHLLLVAVLKNFQEKERSLSAPAVAAHPNFQERQLLPVVEKALYLDHRFSNSAHATDIVLMNNVEQ
jgi:hypothetical protein